MKHLCFFSGTALKTNNMSPKKGLFESEMHGFSNHGFSGATDGFDEFI